MLLKTTFDAGLIMTVDDGEPNNVCYFIIRLLVVNKPLGIDPFLILGILVGSLSEFCQSLRFLNPIFCYCSDLKRYFSTRLSLHFLKRSRGAFDLSFTSGISSDRSVGYRDRFDADCNALGCREGEIAFLSLIRLPLPASSVCVAKSDWLSCSRP